jgi:hypothetical protein
VGYAGKWRERERACELRAQAWTLQAIADELGVSKGSVSVWVRNIDFVPRPRNRGRRSDKPHPLHVEKLAQIERCRAEAEQLIGELSEREFLVFGLALYLGEGAKTEASGLGLANTSGPVMVSFVRWLRHFFEIDESRLRVRLYLHDDLDVDAATAYWSALLRIPEQQFHRPYRPQRKTNPGHRQSKHEFGCATVRFSDITLHRRVMALVEAVTSAVAIPG